VITLNLRDVITFLAHPVYKRMSDSVNVSCIKVVVYFVYIRYLVGYIFIIIRFDDMLIIIGHGLFVLYMVRR